MPRGKFFENLAKVAQYAALRAVIFLDTSLTGVYSVYQRGDLAMVGAGWLEKCHSISVLIETQ